MWYLHNITARPLGLPALATSVRASQSDDDDDDDDDYHYYYDFDIFLKP